MSQTPDEQLTTDLAAQVASHPGVELVMGAQQVLCVIAALQLALRHPQFPSRTRPVVEEFTRGLCDRLATDGPLAVVLQMGWNPACDETDEEFADPEHRHAVAAQVYEQTQKQDAGVPRVEARTDDKPAGATRRVPLVRTKGAYGTQPIEGFRIGAITAFVSIDPADDAEGVCGVQTQIGWMPMIAASEERIRSLRHVAEEIAVATQRPVSLVRFTQREDVETIEP